MPIEMQFLKTIDEVNKECKLPSAIGKISRSKKSLKENYENDSEEACNKFNETWIKEKNHGSLTNHPNFNIEIRNVSIAGAKQIEKPRIGTGYTELSTRFVDMEEVKDGHGYYIPAYLQNEKLFPKTSALYKQIIEMIMDHYREMIIKFKEYISKRDNKNIEDIKQREYLDSARYSLPIALETGLGATFNATSLDSLFKKLIKLGTSESNELLIKLGLLVGNTNLKHILNLDKYTKLFEETHKIDKEINLVNKLEVLKNIIDFFKTLKIETISYDSHNVKVETSSNDLYPTITKKINNISELLEHPEDFDSENDLRYLEEIQVIVLATTDYGAFRDIQRHRMATMRYSDIPAGFEVYKDKDGKIFARPYVHDMDDDYARAGTLTYYRSELEMQMGYDPKEFYETLYKLRIQLLEAFLNEAQNLQNDEIHFCDTYMLELISLTNTLASMTEFKCVTNVREIIHMINQRTRPDSHISYKVFFEMIKDWMNMFIQNDSLGYAISTDGRSERF